MGIKKILSLTILMTSVYFMGRRAPPDLKEVLDYAESHPQHQEVILNEIMYDREKNNLGYSPESLGNFSRALLFEFNRKKFNLKENSNLSDDSRTTSKSESKNKIPPDLFNCLYNFILNSKGE